MALDNRALGPAHHGFILITIHSGRGEALLPANVRVWAAEQAAAEEFFRGEAEWPEY